MTWTYNPKDYENFDKLIAKESKEKSKFKCWKKASGSIEGADTVFMWKHKINGESDTIAVNKPYDKFLIGRFTENGIKNLGITKTKSEAVKKANKYMKSHDKC
jgi:hypothetical protein